MYLKWASSEGFQAKINDELRDEEAGYKSLSIEIQGSYANGWLQYESGVHRLIRVSPFDSNGKRHTSFASVQVFPMVEDSLELQDIVISTADVKVETMRAQGAGGQHVNKTESAIRLTHIPTGLIVQCQSQRSQHMNKNKAMQMLRSKLYQLESRKKADLKASKYSELSENAWGSQIRSYILHPYQIIKDHRSGYESGNVFGFLDGEIQFALEHSLVNLGKKQ